MTAAAASRRGDNRELVALARGGGLNFIGAAITQLATVGLLLYMTRDLSKSDVGLFRISVALFELLKIVALVGLGQAMTRFVAVFRADRDRAAVLGTIRLGLVVTTVASVGRRRRALPRQPLAQRDDLPRARAGRAAALRRVRCPAGSRHCGGARGLLGLPDHAAERAGRPDARPDPPAGADRRRAAARLRPRRRLPGLRAHPLHHLPGRPAVAGRPRSGPAGARRAASAGRSRASPWCPGWPPSPLRASSGWTC